MTRSVSIAGVVVFIGWLFLCARAFVGQLETPGKAGATLVAVLVFAPLLLFVIARLPVYLFAIYAALVPFSGLLANDNGPTYMKLLGIGTGMALAASIAIKGKTNRPSHAMVLTIVFAGYAGVTVLWALNPQAALTEYSTYLSVILLFVAVALYPMQLRDARIVLVAAVCGALASAGYGVYLYWHGADVAGTRLYIGWTAQRSIDPNEYAATLLVAISLALTMFVRSRTGPAKGVWLAALIVLFAGFTLSGSRGATLGLAAMVVFLFWKSPFRKQLLITAFAGAVIATPLAQRFMQADVANGDGRFEVWKIALASLKQYWLSGAGVGNFNQAFTQYFLVVPHQPLPWDRAAHSIVISGAVEFGIPGLLLLLAVWYAHFRELARFQGSGLTNDLCLALRAGLLGLFVSGLSLSIMTSKYIWLAFCLVAMVRSALVNRPQPVPSSEPAAGTGDALGLQIAG